MMYRKRGSAQVPVRSYLTSVNTSFQLSDAWALGASTSAAAHHKHMNLVTVSTE